MNYHARCSIYLRRFWTRWAAPSANWLALLLEAASPDWEPIEWKEREGLRSVFQGSYGELLADLDEEAPCQLCGMRHWDVKHHIVPLEWGGIPDSDANLMALCHACHAAVHPWMTEPLAKNRHIHIRSNGKLEL